MSCYDRIISCLNNGGKSNPFGDPASDALDKNGPIPVNEPTSPVYIKYTSDGTAIPQNSISDVAKQPTAENSLGLSIMCVKT